MVRKQRLFVRLAVLGLAFASGPVLADDPVKNILDEKVPALKDGSTISLADREKAIGDACRRRGFAPTVVSPGVIEGRYGSPGRWFIVTITHSETTYSMHYKDSHRMDYNAARNRIDDYYNEKVAGLAEHIDADFERALKRMKEAQKQARKVAKGATKA
jgi:hypothetical protein